jgi:hypothetical protein
VIVILSVEGAIAVCFCGEAIVILGFERAIAGCFLSRGDRDVLGIEGAIAV